MSVKALAPIASILVLGSSLAAQDAQQPLSLASPDKQLHVTFRLDARERPGFEVFTKDVPLASATLSLDFAEGGLLGEQMRIIGSRRETRDSTYTISVGKADHARDHHHELTVSLEEIAEPHRRLDIVIRAFDDGIAFRYRVPEQNPIGDFVLVDEQTRLTFTDDPQARLLPLAGFTTSYEAYYETKRISEVAPGDKRLIALPILLEHPRGVWIAVTEADLTDYAGACLVRADGQTPTLKTVLSPQPAGPQGARVLGRTPFESPWRVLMIADNPGRLIESNIIFNLNQPSKIADPSWIRPGKTTFPWWNHYVLEDVDFRPGVNTATMKYYIDFCAGQGIPYHSLDGLDIAWYGGPIRPEGPTDVTTAAPSIDMPELLRYAREKGVRLRLWMHWLALKPQLEEAFATYERWGIEGVMIDFMDRDDQEMVRWYHEVAARAARHHLTVTWHGAYKPTGMERTWPNVLTYEGVLNQEYNKWGARGTPPEHNLDVAFVRMLAGPLDYHHGGMRNVLPENYHPRDVAPPVQGTRGQQLAMYIVYQDHLPMMADFPSAYRKTPELGFLVGIPTTWDDTRVLHAEVGRCLVIARRKGEEWYIGGMTAAQPRMLELPLTFLGNGSFDAVIYHDDESRGPTVVARKEQTVSGTHTVNIEMPRSGGFAARIVRGP